MEQLHKDVCKNKIPSNVLASENPASHLEKAQYEENISNIYKLLDDKVFIVIIHMVMCIIKYNNVLCSV